MDKIDHLRESILASQTFCFYPFTQLSSNPSGHLKPCCNYVNPLKNKEGKTLSIMNGDGFIDAWNSEEMVNIRQQLYKGRIPNSCMRCIRDNNVSMRTRSIHEYKNNRKVLELVNDSIDNNYFIESLPSYLELKPSNLCNLKCVMCNSYDSSQISKELNELSQKFGGIKIQDGRFIEISSTPGITENNHTWYSFESLDWSDNQKVWNDFEKIAPSLETLSFAGGEPTIIPFVLKTLHYLVENNFSKNITIFLSSNFTNLNKNFLNLMPKFKKFELIASIDGFEKINDYARYPSKWVQVSKNYIEAKKYMSYGNIKILNNITVSALNVVNLDSLLYFLEDHAKEYPYFAEYPYNINLIMFPKEQQISMLPNSMKEIASTRLIRYLEKSRILKDFPGMVENINLLLNELKKPDSPNLFQQFKNRIKILDEHRGITIGDYIPELKDLFK